MDDDMSVGVTNEPILYYEWDTDHHVEFEGIIRVIPGGQNNPHGKRHLRIEDADAGGGFRNINNISNVEEQDDTDGIDYYRHKFSAWSED